MLCFRINPIDSSLPPTEILAEDAAGVMYVVQGLGCKAAIVERDGVIAFYISVSDEGVWSISRNPPRLSM